MRLEPGGRIMATIYGDNTPNVIEGTDQDDRILGWLKSNKTADQGPSSDEDELYGHDGRDTIYGGAGDDYISGGGGDDTLYGGASDDEIYGDEGDDIIDGGVGDDNISGDEGDDVLKGGAGDDYLIDLAGIITIDGGDGDDFIDVDGGMSGSVNGGEGYDELVVTGDISGLTLTSIESLDTYGYELIATAAQINAIEHIYSSEYDEDDFQGVVIRLSESGTVDMTDSYSYSSYKIYGTDKSDRILMADSWDAIYSNDYLMGGGGDDALSGNTGDDWLMGGTGRDALSGGEGEDYLDGGEGDDVIRGGADGDTIDGGAGIDTATYSGGAAAVTVSLLTGKGSGGEAARDTLISIENLIGTSHNDVLTGDKGANKLTGGAGDGRLSGGGGADTLIGGAGADTYVVDNAGDLVVEGRTGGVDTVLSSVSFSTVGQYIENVTLTGSAGTGATGNGLANTLTGNRGANRLDGGTASDVLIGGRGADTFQFSTALGPKNIDVVKDFVAGGDKIALDNAVFTGLSEGALAKSAFVAGSAATDALDRVIYNSKTGALLFDQDGSGAAHQAIQFATLSTGLSLSASDIVIV